MRTTIAIEIEVYREAFNPYADPGNREGWIAADPNEGVKETGVSVQDAVSKLLIRLAAKYAETAE